MTHPLPQPLLFVHRAAPEDAYLLGALAAGRVDCEGLLLEHQFDAPVAVEAEPPTAPVTVLTLDALIRFHREFAPLPGVVAGSLAGPWLAARQPTIREAAGEAEIDIEAAGAGASLLAKILLPGSRPVRNGRAPFTILPAGDFEPWRAEGWYAVDDLGARWRAETGELWPLWCVAVSRSLEPGTLRRLDRALARSMRYARDRPGECLQYALRFAPEAGERALAALLGAQALTPATVAQRCAMLETAFTAARSRGALDPADAALDFAI